MAERAQVTSVEAIELFRAKLIVFVSKARASIEEVDAEIQRTQAWLENDQRNYWDKECRRRGRDLEEAQQELFGSKLSKMRTHAAAQVLAVERAKRLLNQAQEKRDRVRRWTREFENRAAPHARQVDQLQSFVTTDLVKAVAHLRSVVSLLQSYATLRESGEAGAEPVPERHENSPSADASSSIARDSEAAGEAQR